MGVSLDSGILEQVQSLVCDACQVVSYKWLSRKLLVSSNAAKRILQEFAEQSDGDKVEVVYVVSGWSKSEPQTYSVQLVPRSKLQDATQGLNGSSSHHVYSVQPCLPKDPAQLFSAELMQAQELFMQPLDVNNCLRDNRFSSVSCSLVTRSVGGSKSVIYQQKGLPSSAGVPASGGPATGKGLSESKAPMVEAQPPQPVPAKKEVAGKSNLGGAVVKEEGLGKSVTNAGAAVKTVVEIVAPGKKKVGAQGGGSLANLWGKAPTKPKAASPSKPSATSKPVPIAGDAEAGIRALEGGDSESSSDDDAADFARIRRAQVKNTKGRKRQVVFDDDEEMSENEEEVDPEAVVNLASPEPSKTKTNVQAVERIQEDTSLKSLSSEPTAMEVDEERTTPEEKVLPDHIRSKVDIVESIPEHSGQPMELLGGLKRDMELGPGAATGEKVSSGPKRKKVLKTRIDARGREVTEVVWETDGVEEIPEVKATLAPDKAVAAGVESKPSAERPSLPSKPASAPPKMATKATGKPGGKPAPKGQGNIMSFFKKKT